MEKLEILKYVQETLRGLRITPNVKSMLFEGYEERFYFDGYFMLDDILENKEVWGNYVYKVFSNMGLSAGNCEMYTRNFISSVEYNKKYFGEDLISISKRNAYSNRLYPNYVTIGDIHLIDLKYYDRGSFIFRTIKKVIDYVTEQIYIDYSDVFIEE